VSAIRTEIGPDGEILHLVPHPAAALPAVTRRDLERAWQVSRDSAIGFERRPRAIATRLIRFAQPERPPLDLLLTDRDAASWVTAVGEIADLSTEYGISLCLRLLALVDLLGREAWTRAWFTVSRAGFDFHPGLLQAASLSPLTDEGGFVETALRALLPDGAIQGESIE
jgi:hypothetical protein